MPNHTFPQPFGLRPVIRAAIALAVLGLATAALSQSEKVLYSFTPGRGGNHPVGSLVFDALGNLYGLTQKGGDLRAPACNGFGCGVIFRLSPTSQGWQESVVHSFTDSGVNVPPQSLFFRADGDFYGTGLVANTFGTVFRITPTTGTSWPESVIYAFAPVSYGPYPSLLFGSGGNIYGTSAHGGAGDLCDPYNCGTVYRLYQTTAGSWSEEVVHQFGFFPSGDGIWPVSAVVTDSANLFGATQYGGSSEGANNSGYGTVYELSPTANGWSEQILYNFTGGSDGGEPTATFLRDPTGNLFGLASTGGAYGKGAIYELSYSSGAWTEQVLFSFAGDYSLPNDPLILDRAGNLYGTTEYDGLYHWGTVVKFSPSAAGWTETVLYTFTGGSDGGRPLGGLALDGNGNLYGTTYRGGANGDFGVAFEITP